MDMICVELTLTNLQPKQKARILRLEGRFSFQKHIRSRGILEGKIVEVIARQPMSGPIVISMDKRHMAMGRKMTSKIIVAVE